MTDAAAMLREIEGRLNRGIGLDVHSIGSSLIALAVRTRMKKRNLASIAEYLPLLDAPVEWQALLEEIVVPETWFFRDRQPFLALADWAVREWIPKHPYNVLRILSSPCSSGEEPYSIVMALLDAGVSPDRFAVEAIDISETALAKARAGLYSRNSFRGPAQEYRETYFTPSGNEWQLSEVVRKAVQFRHVNVLDPAFARKENPFDVIFCRNMMIYFDDAARARLMRQLHGMLASDGRLFLGHAEGAIARDFGFEPLPLSMSFVFRKADLSSPGTSPKPIVTARPPVQKPSPAFLTQRAVGRTAAARLKIVEQPKPRPIAVAPAAPASAEDLLAKAQQLADSGQLADARKQCEAALKIDASSIRAHYLLGLICDAGGQTAEAESFYRKTLYLEPNHYEALSQLALLAERTGDAKSARQFQQRAKRASSKIVVPKTVS